MNDYACWLNPALCAAEAAGSSALDAVSDWWYGTDEVQQTTVPAEPLPEYLYPDSPIPVPGVVVTPPRTAAPRTSSAAPSIAAPAGAPPGPSAGKETLSPLWVGAGLVLVGLGGLYLYRRAA